MVLQVFCREDELDQSRRRVVGVEGLAHRVDGDPSLELGVDVKVI